eukprot:GHVP01050106.1.p1 GENE.GHVP01050106.1~~GHVP01050106.1.p1  ORF type:complete len:129 (+),score=15.56 GHVP01050106.1:31-417(+)
MPAFEYLISPLPLRIEDPLITLCSIIIPEENCEVFMFFKRKRLDSNNRKFSKSDKRAITLVSIIAIGLSTLTFCSWIFAPLNTKCVSTVKDPEKSHSGSSKKHEVSKTQKMLYKQEVPNLQAFGRRSF